MIRWHLFTIAPSAIILHAWRSSPLPPRPRPLPPPPTTGLEEDGLQLIEEDLLVEDVSIDGMCGVY